MKALSIIITCHNQFASVSKLLDELRGEDLSAVEIIVADDMSKDGSADRIDEHIRHIGIEARVSRAAEWGHCGAVRNRGVREAVGEYVWFLDGDDEIVFGAVAKLVSAIRESRVDCIAFGFDEITEAGIHKFRPNAEFGDEFRYNLPVAAWAKALRRDLFVPFREKCSSEDVDWWLRQCDAISTVHYMQDPLMVYRQDVTSYMTSIRWLWKNRKDYRLTLRQIIETDILRKDGVSPWVIYNEFACAAALWKYYTLTKSDVGRAVAKQKIVAMYGREMVP